jgi:hypothetical protein
VKNKTRRLGRGHRSDRGSRKSEVEESSSLQPNGGIVKRTEAGEDFLVSDEGEILSAEEWRDG